MEIGRDVLLVVLGWLLGIGSPLIVDSIKRQFQKKSLRSAIHTELRELQLRLAMTAYLIASKQGIYDRNLLNWMANICSRYPSEDARSISEKIQSLLVLSDQQLQSLAEAQRATRPPGLGLKRFSLPFLDSNIADLDMFAAGSAKN
jgi:type II secretory pathway pseudopilin PulG